MTLDNTLFEELSDLGGGAEASSTAPAAALPAGEARPLRSVGKADAPILGAAVTGALDVPDGDEAPAGRMAAEQPAPGQVPFSGVAFDGPADRGAPDLTGTVATAGRRGPGDRPAEGDLTPTDPLYADQWHFPLLGDIETVWEEFSGAGVSVYVTDEGVDYLHEDLAANYDASMHFVYDGVTYDPMPRFNAPHGTACAGLIAAEQGNGVGGTGVAFGATLTGLDFLNDTQFEDLEINLASLQWAENFDVMSNSWGITPTYAFYQSPFDTTPDNLQDDTVAVYASILANGRDGLGTIIVQASGNDTLNAQGDAVNGTRHTASIAATDEFGFATYYTNFGTNILVAAPAGAVTTDISGRFGYDAGDYTTDFGGTSAATPITAGVIALMLEANPNLGWRDVHNILAASASHTGSAYDATTTATYEQGLWFANDATTWNGGGMMFDLTYGYGMVDAYAAVRMAEVWLDIHGDAQTSANEEHVSVSFTTATALADEATTLISIDVARNIAIENIQVTIDITHARAPNLEIWLVSPDGTEFMLFRNEGSNGLMSSGFEWIFGVEAARGMYSKGEWALKVIDEVAGNTGTLDAVTLDFYGAEKSATEVHTFTDDFAALVAMDPDRGIFWDQGGQDVINMAAVSGDIEMDMTKGSDVMVDGVLWGAFETYGGNFEDVYAGDGDDNIYGNNAANTMSGMRGDDELYGRYGMDTIDGGAGDDYIAAGAQSDLVLGGEGNDNLRGGAQADVVEGGTGDDLLRGQRGADTLEGGDGNDTLNGGEHADLLIGGADADVFQFFEEFGADTIGDFTQGEDVIDLGNISAITDFTDLSNTHLSDGIDGAVVSARGHTITINGIFADMLTQDDFIF